MARITIVEDDSLMREELMDILQKAGYEVVAIADFHDIVAQIATLAPDLVLLDINLPEQSGFEICKSLKSKGIGPILILTSRDKLQDELHGLNLGADDYLTKPCNRDRLLARIQNLLRRFEGQPGLIDGGSFSLDPNTFTLYKGSQSLLLSANEGRILLTLVQHRPEIVSKSTLSELLWGTDQYIDENALQVNLTRLRKTLRQLNLENQIETIRGQGYRLRGR
ncbi:response regulator transcription factor [Aneurinibacillus migulanus]|uniref:DNA-binding response regulator, OmpR family, contains REC and winged-helix (WHTH) domain n=2 Tax=Aneurinibacillus migulanus TaxID=47500 RepID=A0A0K2WAX1_ANEMI|nr:response regulator transcription factor [Aneurinibacillus migulanus]MCP1358337.1 response regulator transcription factor [Aneurinibacillus migulanus]MED0892218.1 response regulator transcription factor [Aneurinibacillus migulanus]MED1615830.1 response regulator transcription factor [Aneurinibacillus migulanus]CEH28594.1 Response regulator receiver domain protein [Aneurinibacillus migulanus]SDI25484.1 DNA-binding response regulator, OmpR family, contains REC and winged-helix (wHTH) domain [A